MKADKFLSLLRAQDIDFFCGVPDSLLKDLCFCIDDSSSAHIVAANEGNAIALACGHYLATGKIALVYMQNSGLGNCVNPLLSLADQEVYNIPILLIIGMRGQPGIKDEPQHIKQGKVTEQMLKTMGIKYAFLSDDSYEKDISEAISYMQNTKNPYAFLVSKGTFEKYTPIKREEKFSLSRQDAIDYISKNLIQDDIVVSTTGHISRELYECRNIHGQGHQKDFLTVGSMGHSSSIAAGIALSKPHRRIFCFDGDGSFLMHMGACAVNASLELSNFKHVIFNNNAHDSVGGIATVAGGLDFLLLAKSCGYKNFYASSNFDDLQTILPQFLQAPGTSLLEVKVKKGASPDIPRPKEAPQENKRLFMDYLNDNISIASGAIKVLPNFIGSAKKIIVFAGKKSFEKFQGIIGGLLKDYSCDFYCDFSPNPDEKDLQRAVQKIKGVYDVAIAIGGGSVIDFAKLFKFNASQGSKLIAIPTTAGSGSETTKFAVLYSNGKELSIEDDIILPDYAIIDCDFLQGSPRYLKACCAFDAFAHAIEAFWSARSTKESRQYCLRAIHLCKENIESFVNCEDKKSAHLMSLAAFLGGRAINTARTTAAHALSYVFTSKYKIPHGHACALSFVRVFKANTNIAQSALMDKRGMQYCQEISQLLLDIFDERYFERLLKNIALETNLKKLGIENLNGLVEEANMERMANNPRSFSTEEMLGLFNDGEDGNNEI